MSTPEAIFLAVVMSVGLASAFYNTTSAGLVASYFLSYLAYKITGEGMPIPAMLLADYLVIVLIAAKPDAHECPYTTRLAQFCALWGERTREDKIILGIFPFVWFLYFVEIAAFYRWWALWWLALFQFLIAGWEGYSVWQQRHAAKNHVSPNVLQRLAWSGHV